MNTNKVTLTIGGEEYPITAAKDRSYIFELGEYVNVCMDNVLSNNSMLDNKQAAVLSALNICDEFFSYRELADKANKELEVCRGEIDELKEQMKERSEKAFEERNQKIKDLELQMEKLLAENVVMRGAINEHTEKLKKNSDEFEKKLAKLKKENDGYSSELEKRLAECMQERKKNSELEKQIRALREENAKLQEDVKKKLTELQEQKNALDSHLAETEKLKQQIKELSEENRRKDASIQNTAKTHEAAAVKMNEKIL